MWGCTREWMRVLKPAGSIWVNLGDKYAQNEERSRNGNGNRVTAENVRAPVLGPTISLGRKDNAGIRTKSLMGLPWRYAIGCIDQLGLILRAEVIWDKPNGLPESVTDRVRRSHETWFHFTKQSRYFSAVDEIRADYSERVIDRQRYMGRAQGEPRIYAPGDRKDSGRAVGIMGLGGLTNPLGKLPGSVWEIPSEPLTVPDHLGVDHFAAFPTEWPRRIIQGWSPAGICTSCGQPRQPVVERPTPVGHVGLSIRDDVATGAKTVGATSQLLLSGGPRQRWKDAHPDMLVGYACGCPTPDAPTRPAVVLDPFGGTGTTALCATVLGRIGLSVDLSHDYSKLTAWRTHDPAQRARAARVEKPPVETDGQDTLFPA